MTSGEQPELPEYAIAALRDLLATLVKENTVPTVEYMPNGNIRCVWSITGWAASCTITPHWQTVKFVAVQDG